MLETKKLIVQRPDGPRLSFPDIRIMRGEKKLLLGASGSGKTTLLSVLAGFLPPTSGEIFFEDKNFYQMASGNRDALRGKKLGFVFQTMHLLPYLSVIENVLLASKMAGLQQDKNRVTEILRTLGIADKANNKPSALSQGEIQRAAIARAVINNPEIIIADEPTSALDDANAQIIMDLLEMQAQHKNAALLIATHDQRIAARFSDKIILQSNIKEAA